MAKTLKQRLDDLENSKGDLRVMVFEQAWSNENQFYLAYNPDNPNAPRPKQSEINKKDLMTRDQAVAMAGDRFTPLFVTYVKDWRGVDNA